jgi:hypothetical protein
MDPHVRKIDAGMASVSKPLCVSSTGRGSCGLKRDTIGSVLELDSESEIDARLDNVFADEKSTSEFLEFAHDVFGNNFPK